MSIVRTIMKIVLIIIGLTAVTLADADLAPSYYITDYYVPYGGGQYRREQQLTEEHRLPYYGHEERGLPSYSDYRNLPYQYQRIGLHGFAFENRLAFADGLRNPLTPKTLQHVGFRNAYKGLQYAAI